MKHALGILGLLCAAAIDCFAQQGVACAPNNYVWGCVIDAFKGVNAYYNGADIDYGIEITAPGPLYGALQYQCPEFVRRFYDLAESTDTSTWTNNPKNPPATRSGDGKNYFPRAAEFHLTAYANNLTNTLPEAGDIVSFCTVSTATNTCDPSNQNDHGHVAIIKSVATTGNNLRVVLIEQNWSKYSDAAHHVLTGTLKSSGRYSLGDRIAECLAVVNGSCTKYLYYRVEGWLRKPSQSLGTVVAEATIDGHPWPTSGTAPLQYSIVCPHLSIIGTAVPGSTSNISPGSCTAAYQSLGPAFSSLTGLSPCSGPSVKSCTASIAAGQTLTFTFQFYSDPPTAGFSMAGNGKTVANGGALNIPAQQGGGATVSFDGSASAAYNGSNITDWLWKANDEIIGTTEKFYADIPTGTTAISLLVTDSRGVQSSAATATINVAGPVGSLNLARQEHTATLLRNGMVLVTGGATPTGVTDSAELYDPGTNSWRNTRAANLGGGPLTMQLARYYHTATLLPDNTVLIAGGTLSAATTSAEIFDPATETFSLTAPMNHPRSSHRAVALSDGRVIVVGGYDSTGNVVTDTVEIYDWRSRTWTLAASLPQGGCAEMAVDLLPDQRVIATGGYFCSSQQVEVYKPSTDNWTVMANMLYPRETHTATTLPNGKVLIVGGNDGFTANYTAELYDVNAGVLGESSLVGSVAVGGWRNTATLLATGDVIVAGGYNYPCSPNGCSAVSTNVAQLYVYQANTISTLAPMNFARGGHTATLLPSGQVLLVGGFAYDSYVGLIQYLSSTELINP